jgi:hypothetical protein
MAELLHRRWPSHLGGPALRRRDRRRCTYDAHAPDPLAVRKVVIDADVADAEAAVIRLVTDADTRTSPPAHAVPTAGSRHRGV